MKFGRLVLLVKDYDEALRFYRDILGFRVLCDISPSETQRFVHVGSRGRDSAGVWFLRAGSAEEEKLVGAQAGPHPIMVLYTNDLKTDHRRLTEAGVRFHVPPTGDGTSIFAQFRDLYGNAIVLVQLLPQRTRRRK